MHETAVHAACMLLHTQACIRTALASTERSFSQLAYISNTRRADAWPHNTTVTFHFDFRSTETRRNAVAYTQHTGRCQKAMLAIETQRVIAVTALLLLLLFWLCVAMHEYEHCTMCMPATALLYDKLSH
eukprot:5931-Heterococcus_DN1.PRE.2